MYLNSSMVSMKPSLFPNVSTMIVVANTLPALSNIVIPYNCKGHTYWLKQTNNQIFTPVTRSKLKLLHTIAINSLLLTKSKIVYYISYTVSPPCFTQLH